MAAMRYDSTSVPERYHDGRALAPTDVRQWVNLVRAVIPPGPDGVVIDLGCGTGRFSGPLAEGLGLPVIGVDPSRKMLQEAARRTSTPGVTYREGRAEGIPVADSGATAIFMSNAIHHVSDLEAGLREMRRVLGAAGIVFIRNYSRENLDSLAYLPFFPEAMAVSRDMIWPRGVYVEHFTSRGFALLSQGTIGQETAPDGAAYLTKIGGGVESGLALIWDDAVHRRLARLQEAHASLEAGPVMEDVDYFAFRR